jgi:hypothetical protein
MSACPLLETHVDGCVAKCRLPIGYSFQHGFSCYRRCRCCFRKPLQTFRNHSHPSRERMCCEFAPRLKKARTKDVCGYKCCRCVKQGIETHSKKHSHHYSAAEDYHRTRPPTPLMFRPSALCENCCTAPQRRRLPPKNDGCRTTTRIVGKARSKTSKGRVMIASMDT